MYYLSEYPPLRWKGGMMNNKRGKKYRWLLVSAVLALLTILLMPVEWLVVPAKEPVLQTENNETAVPVAVAPVKRGDIRQWSQATGRIYAIRREALWFESAGRVVYLKPDAKGQTIKEGAKVFGPRKGAAFGQLLARVDDREYRQAVAWEEAELARARSEVAEAEAQLHQSNSEYNLARANHKRVRSLHKKSLAAASALDQAQANFNGAKAGVSIATARLAAAKAAVAAAVAKLERAQLDLAKTRIYAPFDGVIAHLNIRLGDFAQAPGMDSGQEKDAPIVLIDPSAFEALVDFPVIDAFRIGQSAEIRVPTAGNGHLPETVILAGQVTALSPVVSKRMRRVRVRLNETRSALSDGQPVTVRIAVREKQNVLLAPASALLFEGGKPYVFVTESLSTTVQRRAIRTGLEAFDRVEILSGVQEGELLVTAGRHQLSAGMRVALSEEKS
jgi:RND family efflux transporter MFP subunit